MPSHKQTGNGLSFSGFALSIFLNILQLGGVELSGAVLVSLLVVAAALFVGGLIYAALPYVSEFRVNISYVAVLGSSRHSVRRKHGVWMAARLRWQDNVGKPLVFADDGKVTNIWASLDIEVRNYEQMPKRLSDLYLEIRTAGWPDHLVGQADPARVGGNGEWYKRSNRRRVDWLLEPNGPVETIHVRFDNGWMPGEGPPDPHKFHARIVGVLADGKEIGVDIGEDILAA